MGKRPCRRKGTEKVTTLGVTSRMTITSSGFWGMSLDDMLGSLLLSPVGREANPAVAVTRKKATAMWFRWLCGMRPAGSEDVPMALVLMDCGLSIGVLSKRPER